jgi:hypothetical protein
MTRVRHRNSYQHHASAATVLKAIGAQFARGQLQ